MNIIVDNILSGEQRTVKGRDINTICTSIKSKPFIVFLNGKVIFKKQYNLTITPEDNITAVVLPAGGGGGGSSQGKNQATIGFLAIGVATVLTGGAALAFYAVGTGLILSSGVFAPPKVPSVERMAIASAPSPTYSVNFQANTARLGQAIPVSYGRNKIYPDLAASPYGEYFFGNHTVQMLLCVGLGEYEIEQIFIGDSRIENFDEITYQKLSPGDNLTLFHHNVETVAEVEGILLNPPEGGAVKVSGPFTGNKSGTTGTKIGYDIICPSGIYNTNDEGKFRSATVNFVLSYREIDNNGAPKKDWVSNDVSITGNSNDSIRRTYNYNVPVGRYEIRAWRTTNASSKSHIKDDVYLAGAKVFLTEVPDYSNTTLLAVKIPSSAQVSEANSRKINCVVKKVYKSWHPSTGWTTAHTQTPSMAWYLADLLMSDYGAGLSDNRLDLNNFYNIEQQLVSRGDNFNYVYDRKISIWEAIELMARSCRCACIIVNGKVRIVRDGKQTIPRALFSPRNILKGTFSVDLTLNKEKTDGVIAEYVNEQTWAPDNIVVDSEGLANPDNPVEVRMTGITNKEQATREAIFYARNAKYRRSIINFTTEFDGYLCNYGDLIAISHTMMSWGMSGDVTGFDANTETVSLSNDVEFKAGVVNKICFRSAVGDISFETECFAVAGTKEGVRLGGGVSFSTFADYVEVTLADGNVHVIYFGHEKERTKFIFGSEDNYYKRAIIKEVKYNGDNAVVSAVVENDKVHED